LRAHGALKSFRRRELQRSLMRNAAVVRAIVLSLCEWQCGA
jgi:hypothetical protein